MNLTKSLSIVLALCLQGPLLVRAGELKLEVQGLDTQRLAGACLMVALYSAPQQWMGQPVLGRRFELGELKPDGGQGGHVSLTLSDLPDELLAQPLALSIFQDANANGRLDTNMVGIPTEPYGFSNDAAGNYGPPSFEAARLQWAPGQVVRIKLN